MHEVGAEGRMVPLMGMVWDEIVPHGEKPISYLLKSNVPIYFKVDKRLHLVSKISKVALPPMGEAERERMKEVSWASASSCASGPPELYGHGLSEDLAYLQLDKASVEQLAHSGSCKTPGFAEGGLALTRTYREVGRDGRDRPIRVREEPTELEDLIKVEFLEAFIVDAVKLKKARQHSFQQVVHSDSPELRADVTAREDDLFLDARDCARLKHEQQANRTLAEYPFRHADRMPGLYWMYQAAHALNATGELKGGDTLVGRWLQNRAPGKTYRYRSLRTATKFVKLDLDRNRGGDERDAFDLGEIDQLRGDGMKKDYTFPYISDGLSMILAIADFWLEIVENDPDVDVTALAQKLMVNGFGGIEVGDLVYLISGCRISLEVESSLKAWVAAQDKEARKSGKKVMGWRDVLDREARDSAAE